MPAIIILSATLGEANAYAKDAGLGRGTHRWANSASSIKGLRVAEIHELPSHRSRRDRHAIDAALRFTRGERIVVGADEVQDVDDLLAAPTGPSERQHETAIRYNRMRDYEIRKAEALAQMEADGLIEPEGFEVPTNKAELDAYLAVPGNAQAILERAAESKPFTIDDDEPGIDPGPEAPVEKPARQRRRTRCADCQELDYPETHACAAKLRPSATMFD